MVIRGERPAGVPVVPPQGQRLWGASQATAFEFNFTHPGLPVFPRQNLNSLYRVSGQQAAFPNHLQNMATGHSDNQALGNYNNPMKDMRRESTQQRHVWANDHDQSMVWFQNTEDPNDAFRGPTGDAHHPAAPGNDFSLVHAPLTGQNSSVSLSSSGNNNYNHGHGNVRARRLNNVSPSTGGLKTEPNAANTANTQGIAWNVPWNSTNVNVNQNLSAQPITGRHSQQRWAPAPVPNNEYMQQAYGLPDGLPQGLPHGLPVFQNNQGFSPSFNLGPSMGAVPNLDSSSSSSGRVNASSPNSLFGSFSSSIGPTDMLDMDMREECFHSPSVFPSEVPLSHSMGPIPPAFLSHSPAHDFPVNTRGVFPEAETVSPSMLHLNTAPVFRGSSSSESLSHPFRMDSDPEVPSAVATVPQKDILPSSAWQARRQANNKVNTANRKQLPDKAPRQKYSASSTAASSSGSKRRHGGDATSDKASGPSSKKMKSKAKAAPPSSRSSHHSHRGPQQADEFEGSGNISGGSSSGGERRKTLPSGSKATTNESGASPSGAAAMVSSNTMNPRSEKDEYLVRSKRAGMTYKEIRKAGGFTEAESTLRGRFRTLTKPKEERVRKPEFQEIDDKLLMHAVTRHTKEPGEATRDNVPWKLVSDYMFDNGGSYHFGYTTVRKRWEYLMETSEEQVKEDRLAQKFQQ